MATFANTVNTIPPRAQIPRLMNVSHTDGQYSTRLPRTGASSPRPLYLTECLLIGPKENAA